MGEIDSSQVLNYFISPLLGSFDVLHLAGN